MAFDARALMARSFPAIEQDYGPRDSILYALGIGLGMDPTAPGELRYLLENSGGAPEPPPTLACVLAFPPPWGTDPSVGADWRRVVHAEQRVEFFEPLPASARVRATARVDRIIDKGVGKGSLVHATRSIIDAATDRPLARVTMISLARGDGGSGNAARDDAPPLDDLPDAPSRPPDSAIEVKTSPQAALIYRESGDRNPLHVDPEVARAAGFDRPILHGLCTFGIAAHHILSHFPERDAYRLASMGCRFSDVVFPGEKLLVELWFAPATVHFRVRIPARQAIALSRGFAQLQLKLVDP